MLLENLEDTTTTPTGGGSEVADVPKRYSIWARLASPQRCAPHNKI